MLHPEVVDRLVILNAPHPAAYLRELRQNPAQWLQSWYIALFQVPWLAERLLTRDHGRGVANLLRRSASTPTTFSPADLSAYRRAILRPGAASATLAYYRTLVSERRHLQALSERQITAQTLLIWGMQDVALAPSLAAGLEAWVPRLRVEHIADAGHWVQHERPDAVNRLLTDALSRDGAGV
jgi:pimeloyl-ACP methyl ester carboxylesterase